MSLSQSDLQQIEAIFDRTLEPVLGKLEALENDIKEIYRMITDIKHGGATGDKFAKLDIEDKLLKLNAELLLTAKQAGITLPRK